MVSLVRKTEGEKVDDDPIMSGRSFLIFTTLAIVITAIFSSVFMGLSIVVTVLLVVVGGLVQNVIATRAAAQTAFNPARVMGVLLQGITAMAGASSAGANLAGAGFVAGSGAQAGNLTGDLVYGRWLRVPSRWQWWAQLTTVVPCSLVSAWVFQSLQSSRPMTLEGEGLPAPVAKMWAATALIFEGSQQLPPCALKALTIGAAVGVVYVVVERIKGLEKYLPESTGVGLGLVLSVSYGLTFFVGGFIMWIVLARRFAVREVTLTTIAIGCIVAEGIGGVAKPLLTIAGLNPQ